MLIIVFHAYVDGFELHLKDLDDVWSKCLTDFEVTLLLYPENGKLAELREVYGKFFKMFRESSPISKCVNAGNVIHKVQPKAELDDASFVPNYSLGLTQMMPKNLGRDMDCIARGDVVENAGVIVATDRNEVEPKRKMIESLDRQPQVNLRPRRGLIPTHVCRSLFVSRVVDVSAHKITTEERNVWEWVMQNKRNKKEIFFSGMIDGVQKDTFNRCKKIRWWRRH